MTFTVHLILFTSDPFPPARRPSFPQRFATVVPATLEASFTRDPRRSCVLVAEPLHSRCTCVRTPVHLARSCQHPARAPSTGAAVQRAWRPSCLDRRRQRRHLVKRRIDPRSALVLCWSITLVPLVAIVGCFARSDLHQWDMPGHLAAAMLYRDRLWPALLGWNGRDGFGGHPQGYFYPSLFEWVVGGTARLLPLEWAFRGWLALSVLLLPVSLFTFLRACGVPTRSAFPAIWCALATLLVAEPLSLGGFFTATFGGGLVSAQWSLPLVFFHLTVLQRAATAAPGPTRIVAILGAGALLAATLLAHAFNGAGAALLSVIMFPAFAGGGRRAVERLPVLVLQGGVALVLALVWIGPWWSYHELSSGRALTTFPVFLRFRRGALLLPPHLRARGRRCRRELAARTPGSSRRSQALALPPRCLRCARVARRARGVRASAASLLPPPRLRVPLRRARGGDRVSLASLRPRAGGDLRASPTSRAVRSSAAACCASPDASWSSPPIRAPRVAADS